MRIAIILVAILPVSAGPRGPVDDQVPPASTFNIHGLDVLLIRVISDDGDVSDAVIERVFRGRERTGPVAIEWTIVPFRPAGPLGDREARAGDRLIVVGAFGSNRFFVQQAYRDSPQAYQDLATHLAPAERIGFIQTASFLFLLATPVLQFVFYGLGKRDRRFRRINLALPLVALVVYAFYESGIPRYVNIRVDLLLLIPLAALIALLWVLCAVRPLNHDAPRPEPH